MLETYECSLRLKLLADGGWLAWPGSAAETKYAKRILVAAAGPAACPTKQDDEKTAADEVK